MALQAALKASATWSQVPAEKRAKYLLKAADIMARRRFELNAWVIYEEGKAWREADEPFRALLDSIEGRPFDGAFYVALMLHMTNTMPEGANGLRVRASRDDDLTGVTLKVTLVQERWDDGNFGGWSIGTPGGGWGTMVYEHGLKPETWEDGAKDVDREFAAPARSLDDVGAGFGERRGAGKPEAG